MSKGKSDSLFSFNSSVFSELFGDFFGGDGRVAPDPKTSRDDLKSYRSASDEEGMTLEVDLPGVNTKDVKLWAIGNQLVVQGVKGKREFTNRYTIASEFDVFTASAKMANGQLTVKLKMSPSRDAKRITIELG